MRASAALLLVLGGCPWCPEGEMSVVGGDASRSVAAGEVVQLRATYGDWESGPGHCGGRWYVNHVQGGTPQMGTIDSCGRYQAPAAFPDNLVLLTIEASDWQLPYGCADCCSYAVTDLEPTR